MVYINFLRSEWQLRCERFLFLFSCCGCKVSLVDGLTFQCTKCDDFLYCEKCFTRKKKHRHEFMLIDGENEPIEVGLPGRTSKKDDLNIVNNTHQCIQEVLVSSNKHMAARMINQELDMPWRSDESSQPVCILEIMMYTLCTCVHSE